MWARIVEVMLGVWMILSPFIFRHDPADTFLWWNDLGCGALMALLALLSYRPASEDVHLMQLAVAAWLVGSTYLLAPIPPPPAFQNHVLVGWLLALFAVVPSRSSVPPRAWERFYLQRGGGPTGKSAGRASANLADPS